MGNLLTSLRNTANALGIFSQGLEVVQNNVTNASTPGYVKQSLNLEALPFDVTVGLPGGVSSAGVQGARDAFAEQTVRKQQSALGASQQRATDLGALQTFFALNSASGIPASINGFFQSFSQLSINPHDAPSRQAVIDQANQLAQSFRQAASGLASQSNNVDQETRSAVTSINRLAGVIAQINAQGRIDPSGSVDAGVDAKLNSTLEELSQYASFTVLEQPGGNVSVYLNGQTPLVVGDQAYSIQADFSNPQTHIFDSSGHDITGQVNNGQLNGLLDVKNKDIPSYLSDLNTLAQGVADQVNTALAGGVDQNGASPTQNLFSYDPVNGAAQTLAVTAATPDQIAAALPSAPGGNGNALQLAALATQTNLNGFTYSQYYGNLAGRVGHDVANAQDDQSTQQDLLTQAQTLRAQSSSVSLDEEATKLIQFQRAYQATGKLLSVLDQLTGDILNVIQ